MADSNLNVPVIIQATRLDTSVLPRNIFSQSYLLYVIAQGTDVGNVANKANEAGQGAYDAQVRNDEQDVILADHEQRISAAEATLVNHEERISQAESTLQEHETRIAQNESDIASLDTRVQSLESQVSDHETRIDALEYATTRKKSEVVYSGVSVTIPESCCCGGYGRTWFDSHKQSTGYDRADTRSVLVIKSDEQLQQSGKRWAWCAARSGKRRADIRQQHEQHCTAKRSSCRC